MLCFRVFPVVKKILSKRWRSFRFFCRNVLSHNAENSRRVGGEFFSVLLFSVIEKVWILVVGGVSRFYIEKFLSHSGEKFRRGTSLCCVSEFFR